MYPVTDSECTTKYIVFSFVIDSNDGAAMEDRPTIWPCLTLPL